MQRYQLWRQPCGCSVPASAALWLQWISSSTRRETKRALGEMENSGLLRWQSPESEPRRRVSQGFYGLPLPGPCSASQTRVMSGKVVDAETSLREQMCGGGVVGAVGWTLLSHHGRGLSFLHFYRDIFFYTLRIWHCRELWCRLQMWLGSGVAVAMVWAGSCSSDSTPSLGTSICHWCSPKKKGKKKKIHKTKDC